MVPKLPIAAALAAPNPVPVSLVPRAQREGGQAIRACAAGPDALLEEPAAAVSVAEPNDEELFKQVRSGDRASLALLVKRYEHGLFALLVRMTGGDTHRADDLFQETFLRAVRAAVTFDASKRFRPWITAIAVNLVRDEARKRRLRGEVALEAEDGAHLHGAAVDPNGTPAEHAERGDEAEQIRAALERLTEKEREVVLLHFYDGMTLAEVAYTLEVPLGTVKSRLHGALTRLKGLLDGVLG